MLVNGRPILMLLHAAFMGHFTHAFLEGPWH